MKKNKNILTFSIFLLSFSCSLNPEIYFPLNGMLLYSENKLTTEYFIENFGAGEDNLTGADLSTLTNISIIEAKLSSTNITSIIKDANFYINTEFYYNGIFFREASLIASLKDEQLNNSILEFNCNYKELKSFFLKYGREAYSSSFFSIKITGYSNLTLTNQLNYDLLLASTIRLKGVWQLSIGND